MKGFFEIAYWGKFYVFNDPFLYRGIADHYCKSHALELSYFFFILNIFMDGGKPCCYAGSESVYIATQDSEKAKPICEISFLLTYLSEHEKVP